MTASPPTSAVLSLRQEARLRTNGLSDGHQVVCLTFDVRGPLDPGALHEALVRVASRHDALRMALEPAGDGEYVPSFPAVSEVPFTVEDAAGGDVGELLARLTAAEQGTPLDLHHGPLLRARVIRVSDERHLLALVTEHLVADGKGQQQLCDEVAAAYEAARGGASWDPAPPSGQFWEYAAWQRELLAGPERDELHEHWREHLGGEIPRLRIGDRDATEPSLPLGQMLPLPDHLRDGHFNTRLLPEGSAARIAAFCREERVTNYVVGAATMAVLLAVATGSDAVVMLSPFAARPPMFADVVGDFSTPLPVRFQVDRGAPIRELLHEVRGVVLDSIENEQLPYPEINRVVRNTALPYNRIAYFGADNAIALRLGTAEAVKFEAPVQTALFELSFWLISNGPEVRVSSDHRAHSFSHAVARRWNDAYAHVLDAVLSGPDRTVQAVMDELGSL